MYQLTTKANWQYISQALKELLMRKLKLQLPILLFLFVLNQLLHQGSSAMRTVFLTVYFTI